jgi:two-component system, cell cycle sensor histidine kinase PleC
MAQLPFDDKNVLDRARLHRNAALTGAVARTRTRLRETGLEPRYDRELLIMHVEALTKFSRLFPFFIASITLLGVAFGPGYRMLIWSIAALLAYYVLTLVAAHIRKSLEAGAPLPPAMKWMTIAHGLTGLAWASMTLFECDQCGPNEFQMFQSVMILIGMAVTAILCSGFSRATVATFILPVIMFSGFAVEWSEKTHALAALLIVAALPFFAILGRHLQDTTLNLISLKAEKDFLITELEVAKAHSDEARRRAEDSNLAKSRFLASMSHELRTPLNAILGFSEVMAKEVLGPINNPTYREYAGDIRKSGDHLLTLINEILDLSRIEAGRYELNESELNLPSLIEECCRMMDIRIRGKGIKLQRDVETSLLPVRADETSIRQVVLNLLSNALKFTPANGTIIVRVGWTAAGGQYIAIIDNGPGIPEDEIALVMTAFRQGSIAMKNAEQGAGLGLPIVQAIMEMHGGSFKLTSKLREGTEATAFFPPERVQLAVGSKETEPTSAAFKQKPQKSKSAVFAA